MAASVPICARSIRAAAKNSGKRPHAMPSFRLLTRPAWLTLERFLSSSVVRQKTSRCVGMPSGGKAVELASAATWCLVSRTTSDGEQPSPSTTKPTPR
jgi:hypothetical protein